MPVADLLQRHGPAWERATRHPFLAAVRAGTVPERAFDTWLVQDHRFVGDLLRFQARLLARAPRPAQAVLAAGAGALVAELEWFEEQAAARGLELAAPALPATEAYAALLERLDALDAGTALTALWALERVYLDAWSSAAPGAPAYAAFVEHWTTPEFGAYVEALEATADAVPGTADVDAVLAEVLEAERAFWDTALEQGAPR